MLDSSDCAMDLRRASIFGLPLGLGNFGFPSSSEADFVSSARETGVLPSSFRAGAATASGSSSRMDALGRGEDKGAEEAGALKRRGGAGVREGRNSSRLRSCG